MPCQPACPVSADTWAPSAVPDVYRYADLHLPQQIGQASLAAECALAISYNGLNRCSLELIPKAVRAGIGTLVSLSAPTALTVQWARRHQLNLIHQPHHSAPRVYSPAPAATE